MNATVCNSTCWNKCANTDQFTVYKELSSSISEMYIQQQKESLRPINEEFLALEDYSPIPSAYSWIQGAAQSTVYNSYNQQKSTFTKSKNRTDLSDIHIDVEPVIKEMAQNDFIFNKMLNVVSSELGTILSDKNFESTVEIKLEHDIEFSDWEEIVVSVKIPKRENNKFKIWKLIESQIREKAFSALEEESEKEKYGNFVILVDYFDNLIKHDV
ncbi:MAG: hypothetical protein PWQ51_741 [Methanolobus sp.]|jgi:hypothetical protein|nr:hypothetical protein [Methanolobus sp.]